MRAIKDDLIALQNLEQARKSRLYINDISFKEMCSRMAHLDTLNQQPQAPNRSFLQINAFEPVQKNEGAPGWPGQDRWAGAGRLCTWEICKQLPTHSIRDCPNKKQPDGQYHNKTQEERSYYKGRPHWKGKGQGKGRKGGKGGKGGKGKFKYTSYKNKKGNGGKGEKKEKPATAAASENQENAPASV